MTSGDISDDAVSDMTDEVHDAEARNQEEKPKTKPTEEMSPEEMAEDTWQQFARRLRKQDRETAKMWKEEIDTLMNFAGLYSVILAAFNIELYKRLVPAEPTPDTTTLALVHLISAMNNLSLPSTFATSATPLTPSAAAVWINALMFSSLVLGLASAFVGLIIREWLNFFLSPHSGEGERSTYIHCLRWDIGVIQWHVPGILSALSILLQVALALFLSGLLLFLWTVEHKVAIVTTSIVCALAAFWIVTTMAPAFSKWCPYKSPQALAFVWFKHSAQSIIEYCFDSVRNRDSIAGLVLRTPIKQDDTNARNDMRKFDNDWGSIERYMFNSMMDGDARYRRMLEWIRDNVFALGHKLLMDDNLFSDFVQYCLHKTMVDPILDHQSPDQVRPQSEQTIDGRAEEIRAIRILRRLYAVVKHGDPLSHSARNEIATTATNSLRALQRRQMTGIIFSETGDYVQYLAPHICAGGPSCMAVVLQYFGEASKVVASQDKITATVVDGLLRYAYPSRVWAQDQLQLDNTGQEYARSIMKHIHGVVLESKLTPPKDISPMKCLHRYNACCLAMLLARSLGPDTECAKMLPTFVFHLKYFCDSGYGAPGDTPFTSGLLTWGMLELKENFARRPAI